MAAASRRSFFAPTLRRDAAATTEISQPLLESAHEKTGGWTWIRLLSRRRIITRRVSKGSLACATRLAAVFLRQHCGETPQPQPKSHSLFWKVHIKNWGLDLDPPPLTQANHNPPRQQGIARCATRLAAVFCANSAARRRSHNQNLWLRVSYKCVPNLHKKKTLQIVAIAVKLNQAAKTRQTMPSGSYVSPIYRQYNGVCETLRSTYG